MSFSTSVNGPSPSVTLSTATATRVYAGNITDSGEEKVIDKPSGVKEESSKEKQADLPTKVKGTSAAVPTINKGKSKAKVKTKLVASGKKANIGVRTTKGNSGLLTTQTKKHIMRTVSTDQARQAKLKAIQKNGGNDIVENTGRWTKEEHDLFLEGLAQHGKEWKLIGQSIRTRTVVQIRTHAQKYFQKLNKLHSSESLERGSKATKVSSTKPSTSQKSIAASKVIRTTTLGTASRAGTPKTLSVTTPRSNSKKKTGLKPMHLSVKTPIASAANSPRVSSGKGRVSKKTSSPRTLSSSLKKRKTLKSVSASSKKARRSPAEEEEKKSTQQVKRQQKRKETVISMPHIMQDTDFHMLASGISTGGVNVDDEAFFILDSEFDEDGVSAIHEDIMNNSITPNDAFSTTFDALPSVGGYTMDETFFDALEMERGKFALGPEFDDSRWNGFEL